MNGAETPLLSIVVPVYNEAENVRLLFEKIRSVCDALNFAYEVLFVDDGSQDGTFAELSALHKIAGEKVKVIRFEKNAGQTAAMAAGFEFAKGQRIISMDGDLQNDPVDIPNLLEKMDEGYDVVCGWRKARQDKFWSRRVPSVVANWIIGKVTGVPIHDNGCSLKAYRAETIKAVPLYGEMHRFIPAMCTVVGARITELVVTHHRRRFGTSKYGLGRVWRVLIDIFAFKAILYAFATKRGDDVGVQGVKGKQPIGCLRAKEAKAFVLFYSVISSVLQFVLGSVLLFSSSLLMPGVISCFGLGLCWLGLGWVTSRVLERAREDTMELGRLAQFFLFRCARRPLRYFGPVALMLLVIGNFPSLGLLHLSHQWWLSIGMNLIIILINSSLLVCGIGMFGEFIAFANAHRVKDYRVKTFLR